MSKQAAFFIVFFLLFSCQDDISDIAPEPSSDPDELYFPPNNKDEWESQSLSSLGWNADKWKELSNLLEANDTRAFIVLKDGKIVIEQYYGKSISNIDNFDKSKIWYWASAGKTLTSFIVGKAQEDGFLKISDKASDYLGSSWTSLTSTQEAKISVRNQLTMTSGLDDSVSESDDFAPEKLIYKADAGSRWAYHNAPYTLLDQVVENAVGVEFESYFDNVLQNIIGMKGLYRVNNNNFRLHFLNLFKYILCFGFRKNVAIIAIWRKSRWNKYRSVICTNRSAARSCFRNGYIIHFCQSIATTHNSCGN